MLIIINIKLNDLQSADVKYAHTNACFDTIFVAKIKHIISKNSTIFATIAIIIVLLCCFLMYVIYRQETCI